MNIYTFSKLHLEFEAQNLHALISAQAPFHWHSACFRPVHPARQLTPRVRKKQQPTPCEVTMKTKITEVSQRVNAMSKLIFQVTIYLEPAIDYLAEILANTWEIQQ